VAGAARDPCQAVFAPAGGLRGGQLRAYRHAYAGSVAWLGHHQGVAQVYRIRLTGFPGWLAHRLYHLYWVPTLSRKARVLTDWTLALFFRRETAQLTPPRTPRRRLPRRLNGPAAA
jgi:NADH dehydrogenase